MSLYEVRKDPLVMSTMTKVAFLVIFALILWSAGAPTLLRFANAAQIDDVSDTLSTSNLSTPSKHVISFTNNDTILPTKTVTVTLDPSPGSSAFTEAYSTATTTDIFFKVNGFTYNLVGTCVGTTDVQLSANYNTGSNEGLTFTICSTDTPIATSSAISIVVGSTTPLWTNPGTPGSYVISIGGTMPDSGNTEVAVLNSVAVTASVSTSFTFTVSGMATSTSGANGITTTGSSTPTSLPFGTLSTVASSTLGQTLSVATNALNGFAVTVQENQPLTSSSGATIALFSNGASSTVPIPWVAPSNTLGSPQTYGHFGVSSDDADEDGGEFNGAKYAGNIVTPRVIFSNNGPADGITQSQGLAHVFYTIQIGTLQPAGNDYTNTLTYVATPTF